MSLLERIEKVLEDKFSSRREWARAAGLAEESHITTIVNRLKKNPDASVDVQTLAKLADAAGVSLDWLALGRGTSAFAPVDPDPVFPSRGVAVAAAKLAGWASDGILRVQAMNSFGADPGLEVWMGLLRSECEGVRRLPAGPGAAPPAKKNGKSRKRG